MDFYIKRGATLPRLYMEFTQTGYDTDYENLYEMLQSSDITFSMENENQACVPVISCSPAKLIEIPDCDDCPSTYLIEYTFHRMETQETGKFIGEFTITFNDGNVLKTPILNKLHINIID